jgi:hypothetical protein
MTGTYDIGVGRCSGIDGNLIYILLDALIAKRLVPEAPWNRSGTSVLRCDRSYCSHERPPRVDEELFLASAALAKPARADIDLGGDGHYRPVDLRVIVNSMTPILPAPKPGPKLAFPRNSR